jgi:hypothetical protein
VPGVGIHKARIFSTVKKKFLSPFKINFFAN